MSEATTTDLYEVTMAMSCLREGTTGPAKAGVASRTRPTAAVPEPGTNRIRITSVPLR